MPADVHPTAVIGRGVRLGSGVRIEPYAVIGDGVSIGDHSHVGAHVRPGARCTVGELCTLHPHVVTYPETVVGSRVTLHAGARIGSDGFGYTLAGRADTSKMPQIGRRHRGRRRDRRQQRPSTEARGDTVIGSGPKIDNLVQIAHNVRVGAGSLHRGTRRDRRVYEHRGRGVWIGGRATATNHLDIGDGAQVRSEVRSCATCARAKPCRGRRRDRIGSTFGGRRTWRACRKRWNESRGSRRKLRLRGRPMAPTPRVRCGHGLWLALPSRQNSCREELNERPPPTNGLPCGHPRGGRTALWPAHFAHGVACRARCGTPVSAYRFGRLSEIPPPRPRRGTAPGDDPRPRRCQVLTVEHVLGALAAMRIDNADHRRPSGPEVPILDGSWVPPGCCGRSTTLGRPSRTRRPESWR